MFSFLHFSYFPDFTQQDYFPFSSWSEYGCVAHCNLTAPASRLSNYILQRSFFSLRDWRVPRKALFTAKHLTVFGLFRIALSKRRGEKRGLRGQLALRVLFCRIAIRGQWPFGLSHDSRSSSISTVLEQYKVFRIEGNVQRC